jgi:hypothetical protein
VRSFEVCQVVVVGIDNGAVNIATEVWMPGFERVNDGEKLFVIDIPVSLGCV